MMALVASMYQIDRILLGYGMAKSRILAFDSVPEVLPN